MPAITVRNVPQPVRDRDSPGAIALGRRRLRPGCPLGR